mmetsp:Transcript_11521/g.17368  ORF Transcript_11521/g.17368 Transcript_11521/m.17368 type:complete len:84 (+) Transcript_11521:15-266(+)
MKLFFFAVLAALAGAASFNETISEYGMALTYNSHLFEWEDGNDTSGNPAIQGYIYVLGDNATDDNNTYIMPRWRTDNRLRICL